MKSRTFNRVILIGNVGQDPKLTSTSGGTPVCTFSLATDRSWTPSGSDERKEKTEWHYVVSFGRLAEICKTILQQGTKVYVSGRLQNREFTNDDGSTTRKTEVVARNVIGLNKRKDTKTVSKEEDNEQQEKKVEKR